MKFWGLVLVFVASCVQSSSPTCGSQVCPQGTSCRMLTSPDEQICATPQQVSDCKTVAEGSACGSDGWCHDSVCLPIVCGNGRVDLGEACDDGNTITGDGTCSGDCSSNETCGNGKVDALKLGSNGPEPNEQCDDGNHTNGDGCSSSCRTETLRWAPIPTAPPTAVDLPSVAYDAARKRIVMFGGRTFDANLNNIPIDSTFEWNGSGWGRLATSGGPVARWGAGMVYDSVRRRIVLFAGQGAQPSAFGDTWEWDGKQWRLLTTAHSPPLRGQFGMAYDSRRKVTVIYGGFTPLGLSKAAGLDDTWEFDGVDWKQIPVSGPPKLAGHSLAYDPHRGVIVLAGGVDPTAMTQTPSQDTWEYDGTAWKKIATTAPTGLWNFGMAYDRISQKLIAYGGQTDLVTYIAQTYSYDGTTWTTLGQTTPGTLSGAALVADPLAGRVVMFGGQTTLGTTSAQTWLWNGSSWSPAAAQFTPTPRMDMGVAYDPLQRVAWMFGGIDANGSTNAMWSYDGLVWKDATPGTGPQARDLPLMAYDVREQRTVMFGGTEPAQTDNDTWLWDGTVWTQVFPTTNPNPREFATLGYDAGRGKVVVFGGTNPMDFRVLYNDAWEWDGTTWAQQTATGPDPRAFSTCTYDARAGQLLFYGGISNGAPGVGNVVDTDLWSYNGSWTQTVPVSAVPARGVNSFQFVGARGSSFVFGGIVPSGNAFGDTWEWTGKDWQLVVTAQEPVARCSQAAFPSTDGAAMLIFGGNPGACSVGAGPPTLADVWELRAVSDSPDEQCDLTVDNDGDGLAGCADPDCWATCTPLCPPGATCNASDPHCGDGTCDPARENCRNCPQDCTTCPGVCGDTFCDPGETAATCPGDCP